MTAEDKKDEAIDKLVVRVGQLEQHLSLFQKELRSCAEGLQTVYDKRERSITLLTGFTIGLATCTIFGLILSAMTKKPRT
jgi:tetrahydromethanopterin S-methyltransferase subunit G